MVTCKLERKRIIKVKYLPSDCPTLTRGPDIACLGGENLGCPNVERASADREGGSEKGSGGSE